MAHTSLQTVTTSKVRTITVFVLICVTAAVIAVSFFSEGSFLASAAGSGSEKMGVCWVLGPLNGGDRWTSQSNCTGNPDWMLFCPQLPGEQPPRNSAEPARNCDCNEPGVKKSAKFLAAIAKRDGVINAVTDGVITDADTASRLEFSVVANRGCACQVKDGPIKPTPVDKPIEFQTDVGLINGTWELIGPAVRAFNKMATPENNCQILPPGCSITSHYRSGDSGSAHGNHCAFDISCGDIPISANGCDPVVEEALSRIRSAISGLNIIRECTPSDVSCLRNSGDQVIHLDCKYSDDDYGGDRPNPPGENCYFHSCTWECNPI